MAVDAQSLYLQLRQLVAEVPSDLAAEGPISAETHHWLGRAFALITAGRSDKFDTLERMDEIAFRSAADSLTNPLLRAHHAHEIIAILHRALARAELNAPAAARGGFIAVGAAFDAVQTVGKVLREATKELLFVEAYMDATLLTDFAPLAPEGVSIRLLADDLTSKPAAIKPVAERWRKQFGANRPLEVRLAAPRTLHDRLIIVDGGAKVWNLSQSWNHLAARSPASLTQFEADVAAQKRDYYVQMWNTATPL